VATCDSCGNELAPGARFCAACGAAVADVGDETRKVVTVLFADVVGSTALGEQLETEALRDVMTRFFALARGVVGRHGGTVEKFVGDAVAAVFGVPIVHEDDALRAVRAAAELRDELADLNRELEREHGIALAVRAAVDTAEVVGCR
jgi:class 3 adenylate cyclase